MGGIRGGWQREGGYQSDRKKRSNHGKAEQGEKGEKKDKGRKKGIRKGEIEDVVVVVVFEYSSTECYSVGMNIPPRLLKMAGCGVVGSQRGGEGGEREV